MKKVWRIAIVLILFVGVPFVLFNYWPYIFAKTVSGPITGIERLMDPLSVVTAPNAEVSNRVFSFAVAVRDEASGEIFTASSEDRQWAAAQVGLCAVAKLFPYPPWQLDKAGTYYGARLLRLWECGKPIQ